MYIHMYTKYINFNLIHIVQYTYIKMDPQVKKENIDRMVQEGKEMGMKLLQFTKDKIQQGIFTDSNKGERMRIVRESYKEFESFISIHPIVAQYIITECIFDVQSFRKYVKAVFGHEKTQEEMEFLAKNPRNVYYFKNKQYALYTKFLMRAFNKHIDRSIIDNAYNSMVQELDKETDKQFEQYEKKMKEMEMFDQEVTEEKRNEFLAFLQKQYS